MFDTPERPRPLAMLSIMGAYPEVGAIRRLERWRSQRIPRVVSGQDRLVRAVAGIALISAFDQQIGAWRGLAP